MKMLTNKKNIIVSLVLIALVCISSLYFFLPGKEIHTQASHVAYKDINELEQKSDLVIIGEPDKDFSEYTPTIRRDEQGFISDFYTVTDVKVLKVLKGDYTSDSIPVMQAAAMIDSQFKAQKDLILAGDYSVMQTGKKYLLFLVKDDVGSYGIRSLEDGKFNIDNTDQNETKLESSSNFYKTLKESGLNKYKDKIK